MHQHITVKKIFITTVIFLTLRGMAYTQTLFIDPASPLVQVGEEITLTATNTVGEVKWSAIEGEIERIGNSVKYKAPDRVAIDAVTAKDSFGNVGTVTVVIQEKEKIDERFSKENASWEIFINRDDINDLLISDDGSTIWVGTTGGLEKRDTSSGELRRVYTKKSGLPSNNVNALASDSQGGLWVGTVSSNIEGDNGGGLAHLKADNNWEIFNKDNSLLPSNDINSLLLDDKGGIWIGTGGGLAHLKSDGKWESLFKKALAVKSLLPDGHGGLWVGTYYGLAHLKADGEWEAFDKKNSDLPNNNINVLASGNEDGGLWVGTDGGLFYFKSDGKGSVFNTDNSNLHSNEISSILSDGQGGIWVGTGSGLSHLKADGKGDVFNKNNSYLPNNTVNAITSYSNGELLIGTGGGLANLSTDGKWKTFNNEDSYLPDNDVQSLLSDGQDGLWIGTLGGALAHLKSDGKWEILNTNDSDIFSGDTRSLLSDGNGGVWVGTYYGLANIKADGKWEVVISDNGIRSIISDDQGGLWMGTDDSLGFGSGLVHLKPDGKRAIFNTGNSDLPSDDVSSLLSDDQDGVWVGTSMLLFGFGSGLAHLKSDGKGKVFNTGNSDLPSDDVTSLLSDGQGGVWVGTGSSLLGTGGGLAHLKSDGKWDIFNTGNSELPSDDVMSLLSDGQGGLWVGTGSLLLEGGLVHIKSDGKWDIFHSGNSYLTDNIIQSLASDGRGGLWIGTMWGGLNHLTFPSLQIKDEQYLTSGCAAIIIAGGGNTYGNNLWDSTEKISNDIYKMLNKRGFLHTDIYYISPQTWADFNGDGSPDNIVDAPKPQRQLATADIQAAFDWAKTKGSLNQPLYIFFTDHGGENQLQLSQTPGVYIKAEQIKTMVDDYHITTGNKVVFVIDACKSGTMVKALAGENIAIIASTGDKNFAYFNTAEDQSFMGFFAKYLLKGKNFLEAFHDATSEQEKLVRKLSEYNKVSAGKGDELSQEPQFDDTGDGLYIKTDEGKWLQQVSINGEITTADITLAVQPVTQSGFVSGLNPVPLKARASLASGIVKRVWAVIRPPQMDILVDNTGVPIVALPKAQFGQANPIATNAEEKNVWEGMWDGFIYNGEYEITFYAEDNEKNIESSESIKLTVGDGMKCPEKASLKVSATGNSINDITGNTDNTGKIVYKSGDTLKISVTENLAYGYDLYVALFMPDGNFAALKNPLTDSNQLHKEIFNKLYWGDRWIDVNRNSSMGKPVTVVDMLLSQNKIPSGQYCLYAALIPEGQNLFNAAGQGLFVLDGICFDIK
ncbi:MAG: hypothetical protein HQK67_01675 [Desulfamplus sp.]|nr:hypothetical protein [Desulfamplus sp.]